jgi:hypothetical protein
LGIQYAKFIKLKAELPLMVAWLFCLKGYFMYLKSKKFNRFRIDLVIKKLFGIIKDCSAFYRPWNKNFFELLRSSIWLYIKEGYMTHEVFSWSPVTDDKSIFYKYCQQANLPIPELYAIFFNTTAGWSYKKPIIKSELEWIAFIKEDLPSEFVIKPSKGSHGEALHVYKKSDDGIIDAQGMVVNEKEVYNSMHSNKNYDSFVIQERLKNHIDFNQISSSNYLHSLRVITFIDHSGRCKILHAGLFLILGKNVISNQRYGQTGNLRIRISIEKGILEYGIASNEKNGGYKKIVRHPETGVKFEGFQLPFWEDARALAQEAALKFLPTRTIGWDMAITPKGVIIIEAQDLYDSPNFYDRTHKILDELNED